MEISIEKLIIGVALVAVGIASFLGAIDVLDFTNIWRLWPLAFIVIGLASEAEALRKRRSDGGWILIAFGVWMLAATRGILGLTYGSALPLAVVVAGVFLVLHAVFDLPVAEEKENENDC